MRRGWRGSAAPSARASLPLAGDAGKRRARRATAVRNGEAKDKADARQAGRVDAFSPDFRSIFGKMLRRSLNLSCRLG